MRRDLVGAVIVSAADVDKTIVWRCLGCPRPSSAVNGEKGDVRRTSAKGPTLSAITSPPITRGQTIGSRSKAQSSPGSPGDISDPAEALVDAG